ncbi:sensor domain-containing diguanylate cyclase [Acinetobacter sp. MB5]|uniref:sensor domain-containing diguanylate cyclase n=1 Tax=Acinetobacter sp. MB5 TaxID=2069438 RepID=UPI000DD07D4D|nr:sensor domain-containing diguanylate cyclase [Acinetobacter sp. MB5]
MHSPIRTLNSIQLLSLVSQLTDTIQQSTTPYELLKKSSTQLHTSATWLIEQYHKWDECHFFSEPHHQFSEQQCQQYIHQHTFQACHPKIAFHIPSSSGNHFESKEVIFKLTTRENLSTVYLYLNFYSSQPNHLFTSTEFILFLNIVRLYFSERANFKNNFFHSLNIREFYQDIVDDAPIMIYALDEQQKIVMWNKQCEHIFGWSKQELQEFEQPLKLFYPDKKYRDQVLQHSQQNAGSKQLKEWNPLHRDGSILTTLWAQLLLPDHTTLNFGIDITEQRKAEKILKTRASIDGLTQCLNRDEILHQLEQLLQSSKNQDLHQPFCVFMLDLDHFKMINDTWGHLAGDKTLVHFSKLLRSHSQKTMMVGRFGGEEFLVIMKVASINEAMEIDHTLRNTLSNHPLIYQNQPIELNYSAGVVLIDQGNGNLTNLLASVDQALYRAKKSGRGRTIQADQHI